MLLNFLHLHYSRVFSPKWDQIICHGHGSDFWQELHLGLRSLLSVIRLIRAFIFRSDHFDNCFSAIHAPELIRAVIHR